MRTSITLVAMALGLPLIMSACMTTKPLDPLYQGPSQLSENLAEIFSYQPIDMEEYQQIATEECLENGVTIKVVTYISEFSTPDRPIHVEMLYYDQPGKKRVPVIVILPILNGDNSLEKFFAKRFAKQGFAVFIINGKERSTDLREYAHFDETIIKLTIEQRKAIDYICAQSDIDTANIFLFGMSMGAIKASYMAAVDKRINASVIILGGGNLPQLITESKESGIKDRVVKIMAEKNITSPDELQQHLADHIKLDPLTFAPSVDARKVLMVMASRDHVVPYHCQQELRQAFGNPRAKILPTGHVSSILYIFHMRGVGFFDGLAINFFEKNLVHQPVLVTSDDL